MLSNEDRMTILEQRMHDILVQKAHLSEEYFRLYGEWYPLWVEVENQKLEAWQS